MLKSFDIADNFTGILSAGVVAAITPVANNNNNSVPLMNNNNNSVNNNILDATSMKSLKIRPHPYLREQHQSTLLQQQQQQQQQAQLQQQITIQEQILGVGVVMNSASGFGLSAMNSSPPLAVLPTGAGSNAEMPLVPMIKAEPDTANNNETMMMMTTATTTATSTAVTTNALEMFVNGSTSVSASGSCVVGGINVTQTNPSEVVSSMEINPKDVDEFAKDQPDPDNIKMFVGQIPKSMDEVQLRKMFEQYGRVHTINVLRDKLTSQSRGCCFVTYYTRKAALKAQDALHNITTLDGMHHPIQMKPADSENRNERKLFVGMLNKKYNESEVRQLFAGHGTIEECTVLRDQNGQSKGCAFVTFSTKQAAIGAIKSLHQSQTMEGCSAPLVVKFADTQKEKDQKKFQQLQATFCGNGLTTTAAVSSAPVVARTNPTVQALTTPTLAQSAAAMAATPSLLAANPPQQASPYLAADAMTTPSQMQLFQQLQTYGIHPQFLQGLNFPPDHSATSLSAAGGPFAPMSMQGMVTLAALNPSHHHLHQHPQHQQHLTHPHLSAAVATSPAQPIPAQLTNSASGPTALWAGTEGLSSQYAQTLTSLANGSYATTTAPLTASALTAAAAGVAGKQIEGPEGSNLFIYHLPQEFNDTDLASTFLPFGNVLSAKVFIDKQTNLSKCFGFVSYDNPHSANAAIQAMHGFQIGTKRLKVQLKRSKDAAKPY